MKAFAGLVPSKLHVLHRSSGNRQISAGCARTSATPRNSAEFRYYAQILGLVLCVVLGAVGPATAQSPTGFRFWKTIDRPASQDEEIVAIILDSDIYAATRAGLPDVRVVDSAGAEVPYQLERHVEYREDRTREPFRTEILSLREEDGAIEVRLRLPEKSPDADGFRFLTPLADYERHVRVFGSADGAEWKPLGDGLVFDYSRYMDVSNREIAVPKNSFREFKLVVEAVTDERELPFTELTRTFRGGKEEKRVERTTVQERPFRIDRIDAWQLVTRSRVEKPKTALYPVVDGFEAREDSEKKQTILRVRMRREPLTSFALKTKSRNFYRRAEVQVPVVRGVQSEWQAIGESTVFNFRLRSQHQEKLTIEFPERREEQYRIVIHNEDNPPLDISGVHAEGNLWRVVFLGQPSQKYRVFYGSELAEAPKYEAGAVFAGLGRDYQPVEAALGLPADNQAFGGEPGLGLRKLLNNWIFLGSVIGLMVLVLAWSLFRAARHLEEPTQDQGPVQK